ncbi:MAG: hypothetical protein JXA96_01325 [Sedimentisphaerales bacterium]|nr:hypothetical protein [Sedimentisphaerales bacterium]
MFKAMNKISLVLIFIMSFSLALLTGAAQSQEEQNTMDNQPSYIDELVNNSQLTQSQVNNMRTNGQSWGDIRINARMAEQIAANNSDSDKTTEQQYQEALNNVLQQRAIGRGYGNIANENNIKLGSVLGNSNGTQNQQMNQDRLEIQNETQNQERAQIQTRQQSQVRQQTQTQVKVQNQQKTQTQTLTQTKTKKKSLFGRFLGIFGIGKKAKSQNTEQNKNVSGIVQAQKVSSKTQTQNTSGKSQAQSSSNNEQNQQSVSNRVQTQNSSSSQRVQTQQRTKTTQRSQTQMRTGGYGNSSGNQGSGRSRGGRNR